MDTAHAELRVAAVIAAMGEQLVPHASSLENLWAHMPEVFQAVTGRAVDQADPHDVMLCHAALARFRLEEP